MKNITYINAGAGSGKTYTLTNKLADLIDNHEVEPEQVILTTFTVKAANEFREKAKAELYKRGKFDEASRLDNAMIGTIDSVAAVLIQKYWYAIGMPSKQGVMDETAMTSYINQSIATIPTDDEIRFFARFRKTFGIVYDYRPFHDFWKNDLKSIVAKSISFDITDYTQSVEESLAVLNNLCDGTDIHLDNNQRLQVLNDLKAELDKCDLTKKNTISALNAYDSLVKSYPNQNDLDFLKDFNQIISVGPASLKKESENGYLESVKEKASNMYCSSFVYELQEKYIKTIFDLAKRWKEQYTEYKLNKCIVDFSDIEHYLHELLKDHDVAVEIGKTYTHLFVDEFQDCSPMQVNIFLTLADVVKQSYWVGDTKQAIYGFRGGDTSLTKAVADSITQKKNTDGCDSFTLQESWRSVPELVDFSNKVFSIIFQPIFKDRTDDLVPLKSAMKLHPDKFVEKLNNRAKNPLRYLNVVNKISPRSQKLDVAEIANYIKYVIEKENVNPSDIAVLGRDNDDIDNVKLHLNRIGVDCDRESELDRDSKACRLMMALIKLTVNPYDNLAKSEIAYLTQDEMNIGAIIDSKLEHNNTPKENRSPWLSDVEMISRVNSICQRIKHQGVGQMMETLAVELDVKNVMERWDVPVGKSMADINAMIIAAKEYEDRCNSLSQPATATGYVSFIENNSIKLPVSGDGVALLTVHGSKGLEWKYVFLLMDEFIDSDFVLKKNIYGVHHFHPVEPSSDNLTPKMCIRLIPWIFGSKNSSVPEPIVNNFTMEPSCTGDELEKSNYTRFQKTMRNTFNESARLLYVGVTRASEVLVIVPWVANNKLDWFKNSGIPQVDAENVEDILGLGVKFDIITPPDLIDSDTDKPIRCRRLNYYSSTPSPAGNRAIAPSGVVGTSNQIEELYSGPRMNVNTGKLGDRNYNEVGDCIHDIFAIIESLDKDEIDEIVKSHEMQDILPSGDQIMNAWQNLQDVLKKNYGDPIATFHERPFRRLKDDGTLVVGSIDYVYKTDKESVLIDFKSCPMGASDVLNSENSHFVGHYAGQLDTYTDALEAAGEIVNHRLIYYPVIGLLVEVGK